MTLIPDIATTTGSPNDDFTEWTFTIRDGVRFEDGTAVTAAEVALGIERSFDRDSFPEGPTYSNDYFLDGDSYKGPYRSGTSYDGIVVEGNRLTLKMARPFPDMPYYAAFASMGPIPKQGSNLASYAVHPVATGPYMLDGDLSDTSLTLVRNPYWDAETDPGRHQYVDGFRFTVLPPREIDATILRDVGAGAVTLTSDTVLPVDYRRASEQDQLTLGSRPCTHMWRPDFRDPVTSDIRVRKAIGYAFPYEAFIAAEGYDFGITARRASSLLPPGTAGRVEYNVLGTEPGQTDPRKAMELLAAAGYARGEAEIKFPYEVDDPYSVATKDVIVRALERAGFNASPLSTGSFEEFLAADADPNAPINIRTGGFGGWCADWPSGSSWLPQLFGSTSKENVAGFNEPAVDDEIKRIQGLPVEQQVGEWGELDQQIAAAYYPVVVTDYGADAMLHGSRIGGMNDDSTFGTPTWKDIYVKD